MERFFFENIYSIFLFFTNKVIGASYMMNCVSLDFKKTAFYKLQIKNNLQKTLFSRPIKSKWINLCESDFDEEVSCFFENLKVKREAIINIKDNKIRKSILTVNFHNYTFMKILQNLIIRTLLKTKMK